MNNYRTDIDGLRGLAVSAVVLYHYGIQRMKGGFVGVDIFFVISGFVITSLLHHEIANNSFFFARFFAARTRRLLPSLILVLSVSLVAGYYLLSPTEYLSLSWQTIFALAGISNFFFAAQTGYFDVASDLLPMLHTWSLAIEAQYYLIWPFAVVLAFKTNRASPWIICGAVFVALVISELQVSADPKLGFYMIHARAWELLLGGLLVFIPKLRSKFANNTAALIGIILIFFAFTHLSAEHTFPGFSALAPCVGAALVIWSGPRTLVGRALSIWPAVIIGKISYALYLWHWPVLVFYRAYISGDFPTRPELFALGGISLLLALCTTYIFENKIRRYRFGRNAALSAAFLSTILILAPAAAISVSGGAAYRVPPSPSLDQMWAWGCPSVQETTLGSLCAVGDAHAEQRLFLWGESHAAHLVPIIQAGNPAVSFTMYLDCSPVVSGLIDSKPWDPTLYRGCGKKQEDVIKYLKSNHKITKVVLASYWMTHVPRLYRTRRPQSNDTPQMLMRENMQSLIDQIRRPGREIFLIGDTPRFNHNPVTCETANNGGLLRRPCHHEISIPAADQIEQDLLVNTVLAELDAANTDVHFINAGAGLCQQQQCVSKIDEQLIYMDEDHLRRNLPESTLKRLADLMGLRNAF